jgi:hypothetical protein
MAVVVRTDYPSALLKDIRGEIEGRRILGWSFDSDGDFFPTGNSEHHGWLRPRLGSDRITFNVLAPQESHMSKATYAFIHGRFAEMLLEFFDLRLESVSLTSLPIEGDIVRGP